MLRVLSYDILRGRSPRSRMQFFSFDQFRVAISKRHHALKNKMPYGTNKPSGFIYKQHKHVGLSVLSFLQVRSIGNREQATWSLELDLSLTCSISSDQ